MATNHSKPDVFTAATTGCLDVIKELVSQGVDVNAKGPGNVTPLHRAAESGQFAIVEWLLSAGASVNARIKSEGSEPGLETPLLLAVGRKHTQIVKLLLENGANPNLKSSEGITPLAEAVEKGSREMVELLLAKGADVNFKSDYPAIYFAIAAENLELTKVLVESGARIDVRVWGLGWSLLMVAASAHWLVGIKWLIAAGLDVNQGNLEGQTPLQSAVISFGSRTISQSKTPKGVVEVVKGRSPEEATEVIRYLLAAGGDPHLKDRSGYSAIDYARKKGLRDLADLMVSGPTRPGSG